MEAPISGRWTRLRMFGRGASGAVVSLAADDASRELFVVKSAFDAGAAQLRREAGVLSRLCSPHVLGFLGFHAGSSGEHQLFLEFAPGGSLAEVVVGTGGRLGESKIRAYAADVVRGLAYLHAESVVHGDVKGSNVVIGADGRAKLADFGCTRTVDSVQPICGTPAFMAPEVARGEEQGPAADVWALGCTVIQMATGRAPWSDIDGVMAALNRIGYTDTLPEVPQWLSAEGKDFLDKCLRRSPRDRWTASQLLKHPFLALAECGMKAEEAKGKGLSPQSALNEALWDLVADETSESPTERISLLACSALPNWHSDKGWIDVCGTAATEHPLVALPDRSMSAEKAKDMWVSPNSALDAALWDLDTDEVADETSKSPAGRIRALACPCSALPDWNSNDGWIEVYSSEYEVHGSTASEEMARISMFQDAPCEGS